MRHTFQSFWIGDRLSPYEALCMRSFLDHGHAFALYAYSDRLEVPRGVELRDASAILPKDQCFAYSTGFGSGSFSACSNLFRYLLLHRFGGWWVDTDVVCLTGRIPFYYSFFAHEDADFINGAVLYFEPGDRLIEECLRDALELGRDVTWGQIGPRLITRKVHALNRGWEAQASATCYPIHWSAALDLVDPRKTAEIAASTSDSMLLHLWNEIFRQAGLSKKCLPPSGSYLRMLAERHPVPGWKGLYLLNAGSESVLPGALKKVRLPARDRMKCIADRILHNSLRRPMRIERPPYYAAAE